MRHWTAVTEQFSSRQVDLWHLTHRLLQPQGEHTRLSHNAPSDAWAWCHEGAARGDDVGLPPNVIIPERNPS